MTPAELKEAMRRQDLTTNGLANLVHSSAYVVSRWRSGVHKVPGSVVAFLELRDGFHHSPETPRQIEERGQGIALLRYCARRGLGFEGARNAVRQYLSRKKNAAWRALRDEKYRRKAGKWDEWNA